MVVCRVLWRVGRSRIQYTRWSSFTGSTAHSFSFSLSLSHPHSLCTRVTVVVVVAACVIFVASTREPLDTSGLSEHSLPFVSCGTHEGTKRPNNFSTVEAVE